MLLQITIGIFVASYIYVGYRCYRHRRNKRLCRVIGSVHFNPEFNKNAQLRHDNEQVIYINSEKLTSEIIYKELKKNKHTIDQAVTQFIDDIYMILCNNDYELLFLNNLIIHNDKQIYVTFKTTDDVNAQTGSIKISQVIDQID